MLGRRRISAAIAMAFAIGACRQGDRPETPDTTASMLDGSAADTAQPTAPLSDANILALIDHANMADSAGGAIAAQKGTSSDVRAYGRQMVRDHHSLRVEGERLARSLRLTPQLPPGDESVAEMAEMLELLNVTARGRDFDKAYVDHEVAYHLDVLETVTTAMQLARETEIRAYIQKVAPILQAHLDRAQGLQAQMN